MEVRARYIPAVLLGGQTTFFGGGEPAIDGRFSRLRHLELAEGAWVEHQPGWVEGHQALMESLAASTRWHQQKREMYERTVAVPRLVASLPDDGPGHPLLEEMRRLLSERYRTVFERTGLALYRDGNDSVAWHGDYVARELAEAVVATVSLGEPRRFLLRPAKPARGAAIPSLSYMLGWGDLIVMGGSCQRTWRHSIPKVASAAPRMAVLFRPVWETPPGVRAYRPRGY
jgi:alkylated DNA repair dioxygenase AlkB